MRQWIFGSLLLFAALTNIAAPDDWPQWRGPQRDGVWRETGIVEKLESAQVPIVWRAETGSGYSGPTVAAGRVYVTDRLTEPAQSERVLCFHADTGEKLWAHQYECQYTIGYQAGPRASVTIDEGRAYALGAMGHFFCLDAVTGRVLWEHDLNAQYKIRMPIWGIAASPLIERDLVIVQIGGQDACLVALDKRTGQERWKSLDDRASYAAPIVVEQGSSRVVVCMTGDQVVGLDAATGKPHWQIPFQPRNMPIGIATPVVEQDQLFVTSFYDSALMIHLDRQQPIASETSRRRGRSERDTDALHSIISTPVLQGRHVYGVDSYGELRCLDAATGDRLWEDLTATPKARWSTIHFVRNGDRFWLFNERGELIIAQLFPSGYREISRAKLIEPTRDQLNQRGGVCWTHPAFANRRVFVRNDRELVCGELAKP